MTPRALGFHIQLHIKYRGVVTLSLGFSGKTGDATGFVSDIPIYKVPLVPRLLPMSKLLEITGEIFPTCAINQTSSNSTTYPLYRPLPWALL